MQLHPIIHLDITDSAQLLLTPCPSSKADDLSAALQQFSFNNSPALLTMMTKAELEAAGLQDLGKNATISDLQWFHLPIEEDALPDQAWEDYWNIMLPRFVQLLNSGVNLTLQSNKDSGRTAIVAVRLMLAMDIALDEAIKRLLAVMPHAFENHKQLAYLQQFAA